MGTKIYDLVEKHEITIADLKHKVIAVDTFLFLYQFLATIRQADGRPLTDKNGNVTSHLIGLFSRSMNFMEQQLKLVFVFDGEPPALKQAIREQRKAAKLKAQEQFAVAQEAGDEASLRKYAARIGTLTEDMITGAKELLLGLGLPVIQAPSEGEAQAAYLVKKGDAYAVGSNDADALIFGAWRVVKNLGATGRKRKQGTLRTTKVSPELIDLKKTLEKLNISQDQLIYLAMLVGTDYNPCGVKGIGPHRALELVKKHTNPDALFASVAWDFPHSWKEIYEEIAHAKVTDQYALSWKPIDKKRVIALLCDKHDFDRQQVEKTLSTIKPQATLGGFL